MIKKVGWWFRFVMKLLFIIDSRQGPRLTLWVGWGTWTYINSSDLRSGAGGVACSPWRWRSKRKDPATSDNLTSSQHDGPVSQPWLNRLRILSWNKKLLLAKLLKKVSKTELVNGRSRQLRQIVVSILQVAFHYQKTGPLTKEHSMSYWNGGGYGKCPVLIDHSWKLELLLISYAHIPWHIFERSGMPPSPAEADFAITQTQYLLHSLSAVQVCSKW